jgi:hypothetical protein
MSEMTIFYGRVKKGFQGKVITFFCQQNEERADCSNANSNGGLQMTLHTHVCGMCNEQQKSQLI